MASCSTHCARSFRSLSSLSGSCQRAARSGKAERGAALRACFVLAARALEEAEAAMQEDFDRTALEQWRTPESQSTPVPHPHFKC